MLKVSVEEGKDLKSTQTLGTQDPYVKASLALDCRKVWGIAGDSRFRAASIAQGLLMTLNSQQSEVANNGGVNPNFREKCKNPPCFDFNYVPGADTLHLEIWNSNTMSDTIIGSASISLAEVLKTGKVDSWFPLFRPSGREQGSVLLKMQWEAPARIPEAAIVPLTMEVMAKKDMAGKRFERFGFEISERSIPQVLKKLKKNPSEEDVLNALKSSFPVIMSMGGDECAPIVKQGVISVTHVEPDANQAGLQPNDILLGIGKDKDMKPDARGVNALVQGSAKWEIIDEEKQKDVKKLLNSYLSKGSVTLTILRAVPIRRIPGDHHLHLAYVSPPLTFKYEPQKLTCIADIKFPKIQADVRPIKGRPYRFEAPEGLPDGLELDEKTGTISGTPTKPGEYSSKVVAMNACGALTITVQLTVMTAPTDLKYSQGHSVSYPLNSEIQANEVEKIDGTGPFSFTAEPPLPDGLNLDPTTGKISGSATKECTDSSVLITATGPAGAVTASMIFTVVAAPTKLAYNKKELINQRNVLIDDVSVTEIDGSQPFTWSAEPPLPEGLSIDGSSGCIVGTPSCEMEAKSYTITASNIAGSASAQITIGVMEAPQDLVYMQGESGTQVTYTAGMEILENVVRRITGTAPFKFSSNPPLPQGISIDEATGKMSGKPVEEAPSGLYVLSASNAVGSTSFPLLLQVVKAEEETVEEVVSNDDQGQSIDDFLPPGSQITPFLTRLGLESKVGVFMDEGWDSLEMIDSMTKPDLMDLGLTEDEALKVLGAQRGKKKEGEVKAAKAALEECGLIEYAGQLHTVGLLSNALWNADEPQLIQAGLKKGHARKLAGYLAEKKAQRQEGGETGGGGEGEAEAEESAGPQCGVGLMLKQTTSGKWLISGVAPGGAAAENGQIQANDLLLAIEADSVQKVGKGTSLNDIKVMMLGPAGSPVVLHVGRSGTAFTCHLVRKPCEQMSKKHDAVVKIRVVNAINLPAMDSNGLSDPYVILACEHKSVRTTTIFKTLDPSWNADYLFEVHPNSKIVASVWDRDVMTADDLIGKVNIRVKDFIDFQGMSIKQDVIRAMLLDKEGKEVKGKNDAKCRIHFKLLELKH